MAHYVARATQVDTPLPRDPAAGPGGSSEDDIVADGLVGFQGTCSTIVYAKINILDKSCDAGRSPVCSGRQLPNGRSGS